VVAFAYLAGLALLAVVADADRLALFVAGLDHRRRRRAVLAVRSSFRSD
jgi:hypothetical protein